MIEFIVIAVIGLLAWIFGTKKIEERKINRAKVPEAVLQWEQQVFNAAREFSVPVTVLWAVLWQESGGDQFARGSAGEVGLMQLKEIAVADVRLKGFGDFDDWDKEPAQNIRAGAAYLSLQEERTGNWQLAVKAYNQGYAGMKRNPGRAEEYLQQVRQKEQFFR